MQCVLPIFLRSRKFARRSGDYGSFTMNLFLLKKLWVKSHPFSFLTEKCFESRKTSNPNKKLISSANYFASWDSIHVTTSLESRNLPETEWLLKKNHSKFFPKFVFKKEYWHWTDDCAKVTTLVENLRARLHEIACKKMPVANLSNADGRIYFKFEPPDYSLEFQIEDVQESWLHAFLLGKGI
jgi:hypothetical protein